jgi:hypothetical protein
VSSIEPRGGELRGEGGVEHSSSRIRAHIEWASPIKTGLCVGSRRFTGGVAPGEESRAPTLVIVEIKKIDTGLSWCRGKIFS